MSHPIYLDYNATTPISPAVAKAMQPFLLGRFGNPSSGHPYGFEAKAAVEHARGQIASLLNCQPSELVLGSGGTEANNHALVGAARRMASEGRRQLVISAVEHPAVMAVAKALTQEGFFLTVVPVDAQGRVQLTALKAALSEKTALVSVMLAQNEVGTLQPVAEIAALAHAVGALCHTDAAQAVGKIPVDVQALGVDLLTVAGHKLYAPKGVGALYIRQGLTLPRLLHGADHELGRRPGTENVLLVVGLGEACAEAEVRLHSDALRIRVLRSRLLERLMAPLRLGALAVNGDPTHGLPNTLSVSFVGLRADALLAEVGSRVAASAGAACHTGDELSLSPVLAAMGVPVEVAQGTVRLSLGRETTEAEVDEAAALLVQAAQGLWGAAAPVAPAEAPTGLALTRFTHGLGCACKLRPQDLERVLAGLPKPTDAALLVGVETSDDAAVYRLSDELALIQTVDFFTPIVDDPETFGAIAVANALSDVYAMGGRPILGLNLVAFPAGRLPLSVLEAILRGASAKAAEAGIVLAGGHSIEDPEPKFGLAVAGLVHPDRIVRNVGARPGDGLVLTKPLGTGLLTTAAKRGQATPEALREAIAVMLTLNRAASEAAVALAPHAMTDITGFGLLGHLHELAVGSGVEVRVDARAVPVLPQALALAEAGFAPGGTQNNLAFVAPSVDFAPTVSAGQRLLLADAQTSGGLLVSLPLERAHALVAALSGGPWPAALIGRVEGPGQGRMTVSGG